MGCESAILADWDFDNSDFVRASDTGQLDAELWLRTKKPGPFSGPADYDSGMANANSERVLVLFPGQLFRKLFERGRLAGPKRQNNQWFKPLP